MNAKLMESLEFEQRRADKLLDKFLVLSSVQGRLQGVIKHHRCDELVAFAGDLLEMIEDELETIDARYRKKL